MTTFTDQTLSDAIKLRRLQLLYEQLPASIVSAMLGVLLVFVVLLQISSVDTIKAWSAYMLSTLALRGYLWYTFSGAIVHASDARRWEAMFVVGALLSGLGWGVLNGPLFPDAHREVGNIFLLGALVIAFSTAVFSGISNWAFLALVVPTLSPAVWRFATGNGGVQVYSAAAGVVGAIMVVVIQQSMRSTLLDNVHHRLESEMLLAEQQAIFQSATLGIAVMQNKRIVKANPRLAELFGRPLQSLLDVTLESCFADPDELDLLLEESDAAFRHAQSFHGTYRLRRGDGTQFWAEFSGRRMDGDGPPRNVWLIAEAPLRSTSTARHSGPG